MAELHGIGFVRIGALVAALATSVVHVSAAQEPASPDVTRPSGPGRPAEPARPADAGRPAETGGQAEQARKPSSLDELFARLKNAKDEDEANGVAGLIERRLERSGSDTADLLAQRAGLALKAEDGALAIELLDRATQIRPGWAEAWNRRAAVFYRLDDPVRARQDLEEALAIEPRLFTAWAALGHLHMANGDKPHALAAYRRALAVHPFLDGLRKLVDRIAPEVDGRDI